MLHLKNRISMMNKKRSRSIGRTKYLIFIPVVGTLLILSNVDALARITDELTESTFADVLLPEAILPFPFVGDASPAEKREEYVLSEEGIEAARRARNQVFTVVEVMPEFPGGQGALLKFLATNVRYPESAVKNGIEGRVSCSFVVDTDGSLKNIEVIRGIDPSLDREAVRVIREMPKWNPGVQNNMAVAVKYTVPVTFRLQ